MKFKQGTEKAKLYYKLRKLGHSPKVSDSLVGKPSLAKKVIKMGKLNYSQTRPPKQSKPRRQSQGLGWYNAFS